MPNERENIWNVPNALTMLRMALLPVYWVLFMGGERYWALAVFIIASITDLLDGHIARKYNLITNFGKLMDPLADKLMVVSVMLSLALKGMAPWAALLILLGKEAFMVLGGALMYKRGIVVYAIWIGKAAQATAVSGLILCFFGEWIVEHLGFPLHLVVLWIAVGLTLCALILYAARALRTLKEKEKQEE